MKIAHFLKMGGMDETRLIQYLQPQQYFLPTLSTFTQRECCCSNEYKYDIFSHAKLIGFLLYIFKSPSKQQAFHDICLPANRFQQRVATLSKVYHNYKNIISRKLANYYKQCSLKYASHFLNPKLQIYPILSCAKIWTWD